MNVRGARGEPTFVSYKQSPLCSRKWATLPRHVLKVTYPESGGHFRFHGTSRIPIDLRRVGRPIPSVANYAKHYEAANLFLTIAAKLLKSGSNQDSYVLNVKRGRPLVDMG